MLNVFFLAKILGYTINDSICLLMHDHKHMSNNYHLYLHTHIFSLCLHNTLYVHMYTHTHTPTATTVPHTGAADVGSLSLGTALFCLITSHFQFSA